MGLIKFPPTTLQCNQYLQYPKIIFIFNYYYVTIQQTKEDKVMENTEKVSALHHEKLKLHIKYIIAIAAILSLGSVVLASYDQEAFAGQVAFGATITSIVLSVIAIWMSISGERTTNDIRIKIAESTERLSKTTTEIETLNSNYEKTMDSQINELKHVQEQLTYITNSISNVEKKVSNMGMQYTAAPETLDNSIMNTAQRIILYNNIYSWITVNDCDMEYIFCKMVEIMINIYQKRSSITLNQIFEQLPQVNMDSNEWTITISTYWGIINTLLAATVFDDEEAKKQIMEMLQNKIHSQKYD